MPSATLSADTLAHFKKGSAIDVKFAPSLGCRHVDACPHAAAPY